MSGQKALLGIGVLLSVLIGCQKRKPASHAQQKELTELSNLLRVYRFKKSTPDTLAKLKNLAQRAKGSIATEAWFRVARGHLDWYLTALAHNDGQLMKALIAHMRLPAQCCSNAKTCVTDSKLMVDDACREKLHGAMSKEFKSVATSEEGGGGYAKLAKEAQQLLQSLLIHSKKKEPAYYKNFTPLVSERDPIATRARLASMIFMGERLSLVSKQPPHRAPLMLAYLVPYPCAGAYRQLLRADSALAVQKLLLDARCAYTCKALSQLPKGASALFKAVTKDCAFDQLGFKRPNESAYFTQESFVAIKAANFLSNIAIYIPGELGDPVMKLHRRLARKFLSQVSELRVRLPYPAAAKLDKKWVEPATIAGPGGDPLQATVHLVLGDVSSYIGIIPTLGLKNRVSRMLDATTGYHFPGKKLPLPLKVKGPAVSLLGFLTAARRVASALYPHQSRSKWADWVSVYIDGKRQTKHLEKHIRNLSVLKVPAVQIVFVSDPAAGSANRAVTLHLTQPPKGATALDDKAFVQPPKPPPAKGAAQTPPVAAYALKTAPSVTVQKMLRRILELRKANPKAAFHWNP